MRKPSVRGKDAKGRSKGDGGFIILRRWMLKSEAWKALSPTERVILIELYALYNGSNNGELFLSARNAGARVNVSKDSANRALKRLQDLGFIRARSQGAFTVKQRHATTWILTEFEFVGQLSTKDFMTWKPMPKPQRRRPRKTDHGRTSGTDCRTSGTDGTDEASKVVHLSHLRDRFE